MPSLLEEPENPVVAEMVIRKCPIPLGFDESSAAQDRQLLREIRLGPSQDGGQMTDTCFAVAEGLEDGEPSRVGEGAHQPGFGEERYRHRGPHGYAGLCIYCSRRLDAGASGASPRAGGSLGRIAYGARAAIVRSYEPELGSTGYG